MKNTLTQLLAASLGLTIILALFTGVHADDETWEISIDGSIHSPAEILKIAEESNLVYLLSDVADSVDLNPDSLRTVLNNDWYLSLEEDGNSRLLEYPTSPEISSILTITETHFEQKEYAKAIDGYRQVLEFNPEYHQMYTWIAESFAYQGQTDSAVHFYQLSITKNFIDYDAHWFLGDLFWDLGDTAAALRHLTIAHTLNRHHVLVKERLIAMNERAGHPWQEWSFRPRYSLSDSADAVIVQASSNWLIYGLTKAVWKYEPDYAEKMLGLEPDSVFFHPEAEREAIAVWILGEINRAEIDSTQLGPYEARIKQIVEDGFLLPMIYYEIAAYRWPSAMLLMPRKTLDRMVEFVDLYH